MQIVDADLDGEPVGTVPQNVVMLACLQPGDDVSADAFVDDRDRGFGLPDDRHVGEELDVAAAQRGGPRTSAAIRNAVAYEEDRLAALDFHGVSFVSLVCVDFQTLPLRH